MLRSVIEHGMKLFRFQTAQNNSALLRSSVLQFENSLASSITDQCTPSYVLTVYYTNYNSHVFLTEPVKKTIRGLLKSSLSS